MNSKEMHQSTRIVMNLMLIAEEMLFSINLKPEIVKRYESMRLSVFEKLNIPNDFSKYWELQQKAKEFAENKKLIQEKEKTLLKTELEVANTNLSRTLVTFNHLLSTLKSSAEVAGNKPSKPMSISLDVCNYAQELNKFESEMNSFITNTFFDIKQSIDTQESMRKLTEENSCLRNEITNLKKNFEESFEKLESAFNVKLAQQIASHDLDDSKKLNELEMSFQEKEIQLIGQLDKLTHEDASVLKKLREKLEKAQSKSQDLRNVLRAVSERSSIIFDEFVDKDEISAHLNQRKLEINESHDSKTWSYYSEMLAEIDFIGYSLHKLKGDNDWLVEQLDVFCRENEDLKNKMHETPKKTRLSTAFSSLTSNDVVVKDFNEARKKLLSQFKESNPNYD